MTTESRVFLDSIKKLSSTQLISAKRAETFAFLPVISIGEMRHNDIFSQKYENVEHFTKKKCTYEKYSEVQ